LVGIDEEFGPLDRGLAGLVPAKKAQDRRAAAGGACGKRSGRTCTRASMSRADRTRGATQTTPIWTATDASEIHLAAAQIGGS
jgi:hypothetical protein